MRFFFLLGTAVTAVCTCLAHAETGAIRPDIPTVVMLTATTSRATSTVCRQLRD